LLRTRPDANWLSEFEPMSAAARQAITAQTIGHGRNSGLARSLCLRSILSSAFALAYVRTEGGADVKIVHRQERAEEREVNVKMGL
jgi:hypothetical protein